MKKANLIIALAATTSSYAQTFPEIDLGDGFIPSVITNRNMLTGQTRLAVSWLDTSVSPSRIVRRYSLNQGGNWQPATFDTVFSSTNAQLAPTMAANTGNFDFYYGWEEGTTSGIGFCRTEDDMILPGTNNGQSGFLAKRLWIDNSPTSQLGQAMLYGSYTELDGSSLRHNKLRRGDILGNVLWDNITYEWYATTNETNPYSAEVNPIITVGSKGVTGKDIVYGAALEYRQDTIRLPRLRVFKSIDAGVNWDSGTEVATFSETEWRYAHDAKMMNWHIIADPMSTAVYVFYVKTYDSRNQPAGPGGIGPSVDPLPYDQIFHILYCRTSLNNGEDWNDPVMVHYRITGNQLDYGRVPNGAGGFEAGYARIGRVWSCIDDMGNPHVVWFDNAQKKYDLNRDKWRVFRSKGTLEGNIWTAASAVSTTDSLGGVGVASGDNANHLPPGHFLSCDADLLNLYVAWPDTRSYIAGEASRTQIFFRRFLVN